MTEGADSTGVLVWPATHILCDYLSGHLDTLRGKTVIELGAGAGIPGLLAAAFCSRSVITDGNEATVNTIKNNIYMNPTLSPTVEARQLRWGPHVPPEIGATAFDVILGADLMYKAESFPLLFSACAALIMPSPESRILVSYVYENQTRLVEAAAQAAGFKCIFTERFPVDVTKLDECQVLDYGEEVVLQEFRLS